MKAELSADLVRRWVHVYTAGMRADLRDARREEIESDLSSQRDEAELVGRHGVSLAGEIFVRLVLGMPDDIAWRLAHRAKRRRAGVERSASMGARAVGTVAIFGGTGESVAIALFASLVLARPAVRPWYHVFALAEPLQSSLLALGGTLGLIALVGAACGLVVLFADRLGQGAAMVGSLGAASGLLAFAVPLCFMLMAIGSSIVLWDLARKGTMPAWLAAAFLLAVAAFGVVLVQLLGNSPVGNAIVLMVPYPLMWVVVGAWLLRGVPRIDPSGHAPRRSPGGTRP